MELSWGRHLPDWEGWNLQSGYFSLHKPSKCWVKAALDHVWTTPLGHTCTQHEYTCPGISCLLPYMTLVPASAETGVTTLKKIILLSRGVCNKKNKNCLLQFCPNWISSTWPAGTVWCLWLVSGSGEPYSTKLPQTGRAVIRAITLISERWGDCSSLEEHWYRWFEILGMSFLLFFFE